MIQILKSKMHDRGNNNTGGIISTGGIKPCFCRNQDILNYTNALKLECEVLCHYIPSHRQYCLKRSLLI